MKTSPRKFDVVLGNPPYQKSKDRQTDTQKGTCGTIIWDRFADKAIDICKDEGYICLIHPAGWRRPSKKSQDIGEKIKSQKLMYLELHSIEDGLKTFNASTNYDWYVLQKHPNNQKTVIIDYDGNVENIDISNLPFIPNRNIKEVQKIFANNENDRIEMIHSYSLYETRKSWMSKSKTDTHKFPCIYSLPQKGMQLFYSSINTGHFGIPKVIFTNGAASQIILDSTGEYGLTQFAYGIVDTVDNLKMIEKAMKCSKFITFCENFKFTFDRYDYNYISLFRKDFWKEFVDENGNEKV